MIMHSVRFTDRILYLSKDLVFGTVAELDKQVKELLKEELPVAIDLSAIDRIDSAGVAFLEELQERVKKKGSSLIMQGVSEEVKAVLKTFSSEAIVSVTTPERIGYFEKLGTDLLAWGKDFFSSLLMAADVFYWALRGLADHKGQRKGSLAQQCYILGFQAIPVVSFLSFIFGFIISLQAAVQLRQFGADIFLADMISISMVREMGPLITAIIIAGRSGSAIASEIASMQVSEEIDALRMMAINPIRYVVVPKFHAITIVMPLLVTFSIMVGVFGGLLIGMSYLDLSLVTFYSRSVEILSLKDVVVSLGKSTFFAWVIVIIGSHFGFQVRGGAEGVGKATTNSVVASIFSVIFFDALFSLIYL